MAKYKVCKGNMVEQNNCIEIWSPVTEEKLTEFLNYDVHIIKKTGD